MGRILLKLPQNCANVIVSQYQSQLKKIPATTSLDSDKRSQSTKCVESFATQEGQNTLNHSFSNQSIRHVTSIKWKYRPRLRKKKKRVKKNVT